MSEVSGTRQSLDRGQKYAIGRHSCHGEKICLSQRLANRTRGVADDSSSDDRMRRESGVMKILLIEDDENVAEVLAEAFAIGGHDIAIAHTGEDGLASLARHRPDAVVLDVRLPKLNGVEVLRQIRSLDRELPVIIMTGLATAGELTE